MDNLIQGFEESIGLEISLFHDSAWTAKQKKVPPIKTTSNIVGTMMMMAYDSFSFRSTRRIGSLELEIYGIQWMNLLATGWSVAEALNPPLSLSPNEHSTSLLLHFDKNPATLDWPTKLHEGSLPRFLVREVRYAPPASILSAKRARQLAAGDSFTANDVVFLFPNSKYGLKKLWANSAFLSSSSDYFKTMFESGFSESIEVKLRTSSASYDSDEEAEAPERRSTAPGTIQQVIIKESSYNTYRAIFSWLGSEEISFAPLLSNLHQNNLKNQSYTPSVEFSTSPKSVYKLAHQLSLPKLCALALESYRIQLSHHNIIQELFSGLSATYPDVRDVGIKIAVDCWSFIKDGEGMKNVEEEMCTGGMSEDRMRVVFALLKAIKSYQEHKKYK